jgi:UDP-glucose 4-epimerase
MDSRIFQNIPIILECSKNVLEFSRIFQSFLNKDICIESNIIGTTNVINFCLKKKIPIFYSGSSSIFGNNFSDENLSPYAWTKSKGIEMIKNYSKWFGLKYKIVYFYNVYGPGQITSGHMAAVVGKFENCYKKKKPLPVVKPGTYKRDFTHIDDIINGCILALKKNNNEEYRLGNGELIKIIDLAKLFKSKIIMIPERKGERIGQSAKIVNGFKKLNYKPKYNIKDIYKFVDKIIQFNSTLQRNIKQNIAQACPCHRRKVLQLFSSLPMRIISLLLQPPPLGYCRC